MTGEEVLLRIRTRFSGASPPRSKAPAGDARLTLLLRQYFDNLKAQPLPAALSKLIEQWDSEQGTTPPQRPDWPRHRRS
ncbi:hypothetical protein [Oleomonas cavernae]|uniref:hypothetical protein n=1 Tax=Oleomonas cavernae TaxID=2320859 RepID=UPI0011C3AB3C|nr:hypothetical protein [Oleomonas cavernae]